MSYPTLTLSAANAAIAPLKIKIVKCELGYYEVALNEIKLQNKKLIDLVHAILRHVAKPEFIHNDPQLAKSAAVQASQEEA